MVEKNSQELVFHIFRMKDQDFTTYISFSEYIKCAKKEEILLTFIKLGGGRILLKELTMINVFIVCIALMAMLVLFSACSSTSDTSGDAKMYLTSCILPGNPGGMPGTFILPNGTRVVPNSAIEEGDYLYAAGFGKITDTTGAIDYIASTETANAMITSAVSAYMNTAVSFSTVSRSSTDYSSSYAGRSQGGSSSTFTATEVSAALSGLEDCGYVQGPDGTVYILKRTNLANVIEGYQSSSEKAAERAGRYGDRFVNNFIDSLF